MSIPNLPDILGAALHGALADTQAWLARQGQFDPTQTEHGQADTGQDPLALVRQRLAQQAQTTAQGKTTLPFIGQVDYSKLPGPLNALAHVGAGLDDTAGLTGEAIGNAFRGVSGGVAALNAIAAQSPGLPGLSNLTAEQQAQRAQQGRDILSTFAHSGPIAAEQAQQRADEAQHKQLDAEGLAGALSMVTPGQEATLPAELAANAPRLAALVDALNAVSKASVKPFEVAPVLHPLEATGIPLARRTLGEIDRAATLPLNPDFNPAIVQPATHGPVIPNSFPGDVRRSEMIPGIGLNGKKAIGPVLPKDEGLIAQLVAHAANGESGVAPSAGIQAPLSFRGTLGDWVGRATDNSQRDMPLGTGPSQLPQQPSPLTALALDQLQHLPAKPIADPAIKPGQAPLRVDTTALPDLPTTPEAGNVNIPPLDAMRQLMQSGDGGRGMVYPPSDPAFYAKRLGLDPAQVPDLLAQLEQDGTLGRDHTGALTIKTPTATDTGIPPEAITPEQEAQAAHFAYPDDQPQAQTPMPDFPGYSGQDRASILRALPPQQIDTLLGVAYGHPEAITNAYAKYNDPAALVDAALTHIQTEPGKAAQLTQLDPELAQAVAFLPDAAEQGAQAATTPATKPLLTRMVGELTGGGMGIVPPIFNTPPALALGNAVGGGVGALGNIAKAYAAAVKDAGQHFADVQAGPDTGFLPGSSNGFLRASSALRVEHKTFAGVQARNLLNNAFNASAAGGVSPTTYLAAANDMAGRLPQYLTAIRQAEQLPAGPAQDAALAAAHLDILPSDWQSLRQQYGDTAISGVLAKLGEDFQRQDQASADVKMIPGALRGATTSMLGPAQLIGLPGVALGAARGAALPFRSRLQTNLNLPIDQAGRLSVAMKALQASLAGGATIDQAGDAAGQAAIRAFGDFTNHGGAGEWANAVIPGYQWTGAQARVLGNIAHDHPELAPAMAIAAQHGLYPQVNRAEPGKTATVEINDQTPGVGLVARAMNGGAAGTANVNPLFPFSPVAGDVLNLADEIRHPERHPMVSPLQNALEALDSAGVQINPAIAIALEKAGVIQGAPSDPNRLAKLGQAADVAFNDWLDAHTQAGDKQRLVGAFPTLGGLFAPDGAAGGGYDPQGIMAGRVHSPAVDKAANELAYEQTGKPLDDPSNRDLVQQTFDPNSPLMKQAKTRAGQQLVAQALSGEFGPTPITATTDTAQQGAVAEEALRAAGVAPDQVKAIEIATGEPLAAAQAQMLADLQTATHDAARIYGNMTMQDRGQLLIQWFDMEHQTAAMYAPQYTAGLQSIEKERYGLNPAGTTAAQVHAYDMQRLGLTPGGGGGPLPWQYLQGIPSAQADLSQYFHSPAQVPTAPALPYQLPPGAGRP